MTTITTPENDPRLQQTAAQLQHNWLIWGLMPLAFSILATLMVAAYMATATDMSPMQMERRFQVILAISAGLFLIGFSLDSHWTSAQKLAKRLAQRAGLDPMQDPKKAKKLEPWRVNQKLAPQADLVFESIAASSLALTIIGAAIGLTAILAAAARLGISYSAMMLIVAAAYQLFVFSRHSYYKEVMAAAAAGKLVYEPKQ